MYYIIEDTKLIIKFIFINIKLNNRINKRLTAKKWIFLRFMFWYLKYDVLVVM